jgi:hypothetical protein
MMLAPFTGYTGRPALHPGQGSPACMGWGASPVFLWQGSRMRRDKAFWQGLYPGIHQGSTTYGGRVCQYYKP